MKNPEKILKIDSFLSLHNIKNSDENLIYNIISNLEECIAIINNKGVIISANPSFLKLFNIQGEHYRGEDFFNFIAKSYRKKIQNLLKKSPSKLKPYYILDMQSIKKDFIEFQSRCRVIPIIRPDKTWFILNVIDQTPKIDTANKLEHLHNLASIGTFATGIAHEFNNALTGIRGYAQLASKDMTNVLLLEKAFAIIEAECIRGSDLCKNMSLFSSRTQINPEPVLLKDLIETVLTLQRKFLTHENIDIHKQINYINPVMLDKFQIQQVLLNLIINARHAIIPKGKGRIIITAFEDKKNIIIEIADNGIGISDNDLPKIFDPFFTSKGPIGLNISGKEIKGTGLGLAVSHSIIKKHKGSISVKSKPNYGSSFTIKLPKINAPVINNLDYIDEKKHYVHNISTYKALKVLVVDDEISIRELLFKTLTEIEMTVSLARNAEEALALCKSEKFDIIFLDYILPEMNGDNLIPLIKEHLPESKIVMISGWTSSPVKKKKIEKKVNAWIEKPFNISQIFSCIQELAPGEIPKN